MSDIIKELRKIRIGPYAAPDLVGTIIIFYLISRYLGTEPFTTILIGLKLGVIAHVVAGINTPMVRQLTESRGVDKSDSIESIIFKLFI